jgi:hypothetical protein
MERTIGTNTRICQEIPSSIGIKPPKVVNVVRIKGLKHLIAAVLIISAEVAVD